MCVFFNVLKLVNINQTSLQDYQYPIFALVPKDFRGETVEHFVNNITELFRKASLTQKYTLMKYLIEAYSLTLNKLNGTNKNKFELSKKTISRNELETINSPIVRTAVVEEGNEEGDAMDIDIPIDSDIPLNSQHSIDLLKIFQEYVQQQEQNSSLVQDMEDISHNLSALSPPPHLPVMNISDLFENEDLNTNNDLELSFLRQPQEQQSINLTPPVMETRSKEQTSVRRSARIQTLPHRSYDEREAVESSPTTNTQIFRSSLASPAVSNQLPNLNEPAAAVDRQRRRPPNTYITEEEYSLRFRLPRRTFLAISELPHARYNIETSSYSYFPMDMTLIDEEYLYEENANILPTNSNLPTIQLQLTTDVPAAAGVSLTPSALLTVTGDNLSSLNVIRQAPSAIMEMSSFANRPLVPVGGIEISRIEEERSRPLPQDMMSPIIEPVGVPNNEDTNVSIDSVPSIGGAVATAAGYSFSLF